MDSLLTRGLHLPYTYLDTYMGYDMIQALFNMEGCNSDTVQIDSLFHLNIHFLL